MPKKNLGSGFVLTLVNILILWMIVLSVDLMLFSLKQNKGEGLKKQRDLKQQIEFLQKLVERGSCGDVCLYNGGILKVDVNEDFECVCRDGVAASFDEVWDVE